VLGLLVQAWRLLRALAGVVRDPAGRALGVLAVLQLVAGTVFAGRVFTIVFVLTGVGLLAWFITMLAMQADGLPLSASCDLRRTAE
jgi:hypothetical protein